MKVTSEDELAEIVRGRADGLRIQGGGTRPVGRPALGDVLDVSGLAGIRLYEPGALTLVAGAGTPLAEVEAALAAEGQRLAFEPPDWRGLLGTTGEPTLGGMVAANASGPRRVQAGACRDALLGVRFVDGTGAVVKNGGRVMKNVTGYDLVKLMAGSWGTLGILTEVSLKVLPAPEAVATLVFRGRDHVSSADVFARALGSPYDVTGAARLPENAGEAAETYVRVEGLAGSVAYRAERLAAIFPEIGAPDAILTDPGENARLWRRISDLDVFRGTGADVWRISVRPSDMVAVTERLSGAQIQLDWGGGLIWAGVEPGLDLRARLGVFAGHATLIRASEATRARIAPFQPEPAAIAAISAGLRARFDPRGILNAGLMG
ncbi:MAG: FAD-binding protein [Paracoccaceae bacterium]